MGFRKYGFIRFCKGFWYQPWVKIREPIPVHATALLFANEKSVVCFVSETLSHFLIHTIPLFLRDNDFSFSSWKSEGSLFNNRPIYVKIRIIRTYIRWCRVLKCVAWHASGMDGMIRYYIQFVLQIKHYRRTQKLINAFYVNNLTSTLRSKKSRINARTLINF